MSRASLAGFKASVIIPVYKDIEALNAILHGLERQTEKNFEVIVSEDDQSPLVQNFLVKRPPGLFPLVHLSQPDNGYQKSKALNRAVAQARSPYLIFIDGDCVPHRTFVDEHLRASCSGVICAGRRAKLGPRASKFLRRYPGFISLLDNPLSYFIIGMFLHFDRLTCFEAGFKSRLLQRFFAKPTGIVGCNFSCFRSDFLLVNGCNEALPDWGGDDDDLDWRFRAAGLAIQNVKFIAIVYHLFHVVKRVNVERNLKAMSEAKSLNKWFCDQGVNQYLS